LSRGTLLKSGYLSAVGLSSLKMVAGRHRHAPIITSTGDELLRNVNVDDLEWPWTLKILILCDFLAIFGCKRVNCDKMGGDGPRLPANRNCPRLSRISWALAQIFLYLPVVQKNEVDCDEPFCSVLHAYKWNRDMNNMTIIVLNCFGLATVARWGLSIGIVCVCFICICSVALDLVISVTRFLNF